MYEKFGEFDSAAEINKVAATKRGEGDEDALIQLAIENGLDKEDAEDYMDGVIDILVTPVQAAVGKLKLEAKDLKLTGVLMDWVQELIEKSMNEPEMAAAVRKKGKELAGYIALTADEGYKARAVVDKRIVAKCGALKKIVGNHEFSIGIPNKAQRKQLMDRYYLGRQK